MRKPRAPQSTRSAGLAREVVFYKCAMAVATTTQFPFPSLSSARLPRLRRGNPARLFAGRRGRLEQYPLN
eukprot:9218027-Heterocapsa_arctica.AAC.1